MRILFLLAAGLILYGSLYPWHFEVRELEHFPFWYLLAFNSPAGVRWFVRDAIVNLALYMPLGAAAVLALSHRRAAWQRIAAAAAAGLALSVTVELLQLYVPTRTCSPIDVVCNFIGALAGATIAALLPEGVDRKILKPAHARPDALLLATAWLTWQVFPLWPQLKRVAVIGKLQQLTAASPSFEGSLANTVAWLGLASALELLLPAAAVPLVLVLLIPVLPAKILIYGRTMSWSEVTGAAAGITLWTIVFARHRRTRCAFPVLAVGALVATELLPWNWSAVPAPMSLIPFAASLEGEPLASAVTLLQKTCLYASAVWLCLGAGWGLLASATLVATLLLGLEVAQTHLGGRVPETTDAVVALLAAAGLFLAKRASRKH